MITDKFPELSSIIKVYISACNIQHGCYWSYSPGPLSSRCCFMDFDFLREREDCHSQFFASRCMKEVKASKRSFTAKDLEGTSITVPHNPLATVSYMSV